jgi:hypothetical protein
MPKLGQSVDQKRLRRDYLDPGRPDPYLPFAEESRGRRPGWNHHAGSEPRFSTVQTTSTGNAHAHRGIILHIGLRRSCHALQVLVPSSSPLFKIAVLARQGGAPEEMLDRIC